MSNINVQEFFYKRKRNAVHSFLPFTKNICGKKNIENQEGRRGGLGVGGTEKERRREVKFEEKRGKIKENRVFGGTSTKERRSPFVFECGEQLNTAERKENIY